ncbi:MAG TPA: multicopper oxidase domain-containing protein, partial [Gammaproteobacteria bacterium]
MIWPLFVFLTIFSSLSEAVVNGVTGTSFNLTARTGYVSTPDGGSILSWGYALDGGLMQYPGPTMIVNQGDLVTVTLNSEIGRPVSILFPGQQSVSASGGSAGLLTQESTGPADTVTYTFVASNAGTYMYHSGTQPELQMEMGLMGALIVRPVTAGQAYGHADTAYDHE